MTETHMYQTSPSARRRARLLPFLFTMTAAMQTVAHAAGPDAGALLAAGGNHADWVLPAHTYAGNRYVDLGQIDKANVKELREAWRTQIADDGEQEASPIVWKGKMYVSTPHDGVLALDARSGKLLWQFAYDPAYVLLFAVNRGVGLVDGKVFVATQDCRIVALDADNGHKLWDVQGCEDTSNSFYSMAAYVYKDQIIVGTGGGDNGNIGLVSAFSARDGHRLWDWQTIPGPGEPGHETWPGNSWKHGGGSPWSGLAFDQDEDTLFVAPGNPGPDLVLKGREGRNLYTNSLVALDISDKKPRIKWYYQLTQNDTHDTDPAMIPVVFEGVVAGRPRKLVAIGDKAGNFVILDRQTGKVVYRMAVSRQEGLDTPPTAKGVLTCPNHGGGIEWNGGAYDPSTNLFVIPSTDECGVFALSTESPEYIPGQPYEGGSLPSRGNATGVVTAIDVGTGKVRWREALPFPSQGGALLTSSGLAFVSDTAGDVDALDAATGKPLWKTNTGSSIVAPISAYRLDGAEYLSLVVGEPGNQGTPNLPGQPHGSWVVTYRVGAQAHTVNDASGQVAVADAPNGQGEGGTGTLLKPSGPVPYTSAQVGAGAEIYEARCASCHGDKLQGISAPALTGASFGRSKLDASQLRGIVAQTMPLTAPGSLKPEESAAITAYIMKFDCAPQAGGGRQPFPSGDAPVLHGVAVGGRTCGAK